MKKWTLKKPSEALQLFFGVMTLVIVLMVLTAQLWLSRLELKEIQIKNILFLNNKEILCQKYDDKKCISFNSEKLSQLLQNDKVSSQNIFSLFFPIILTFFTIALLFIRYRQQLNYRILEIKNRITGALELEFPPVIHNNKDFQILENAVEEIYLGHKNQFEILKKEIISEENKNFSKSIREFLVPPTQIGNERFECYTHYESAKDGCGGDWWGYFEIDHKIVLGIGDVTGSGLSAGFVVAGVKSAFSVIHKMATEQPHFDLHPSEILNLINSSVFEMTGTKMMMTLFLGVIDLKENTITYSNAGHNPPWIYRKKTESTFETISLVAQGNRLGEGMNNPALEEKTIPIQREDVLILYTDGLLDNKNSNGESFGKKRVRALIDANLLSGTKLCLSALVEQIHDHHSGKDIDDDITVVLIQILAES